MIPGEEQEATQWTAESVMALFDEFPCLDDAAQEIADAWNDNNNFTSARIIERDEANVALAAALARAEAAEQRSRMWQWSFRLACDYIDLMLLALAHPFLGWIPRWLLRDLPPHPRVALLTPDAPKEDPNA